MSAFRRMGRNSKLAVQYAHRHSDEYRNQLGGPRRAADHVPAVRGAVAQAQVCPSRQDQVEAVRAKLEETGGWLLILDNAKDEAGIERVVPRSGGHVLITSQRARWDAFGADIVRVDVMTEEEAVALLEKRAPGSDADLRLLAEALMRIPLALEQASAYMRSRHMSVSRYLNLLRDHAPELLDKEAPRDYERTLVGTWRLALAEVERTAGQKVPGAVELLSLCAFLAPDNIPLGVFEKHADALPEPVATVVANPLARADAVGLLADHSHLRWNDDGTVGAESVSLHRTVQHFARERLDPAGRRTWSGAAVSVVLAAFPDDPADVSNWEACAILLPHATAALEQAAELGVQPLGSARLLLTASGSS